VIESPAPGTRIRESFLQAQLVPVLVPTFWHPEVTSSHLIEPPWSASFSRNSSVCALEKGNLRIISQFLIECRLVAKQFFVSKQPLVM
jgi:hypothetical protein